MTEAVATHPEGSPKAPRVSFFTLGCRLNQYDTAALRARLVEAGMREASPPDVIVVNTCTVTGRADQEARQLLRRLHRENPEARLVVTGCYAQRAPDELRGMPGVSAVLGTAERDDPDALLRAAGGEPMVAVGPARAARGFATEAALHVGRSRALLKIQDGCDSFCSYCIVPYVRGRSRCLPATEALERAGRVLEAGFSEIVLTGADLASYPRLASLVEAMLSLGPGHRVRLSSIEPHKMDPALVGMIGTESRLCRHLHLPLQSGSNRILDAMRRGYTREEYGGLLERITARGPVGIGADVIVGFPGEDEAEFQETFRFVERSPISFLHVFRYSSRPGTAAARLPESVPDAVARERAECLRVLGEAKARAFRRSFLGATLPVVWERGVGRRGRVAMSDVYVPIEVVREEAAAKGVFEVRVHDEEGDRLVAT